MINSKITTDIMTTTGFAIDIPTAKVVINNQEITDLETFNKVVNSIKEKDKEIERLNNIIEEKKIPEKLDYIHPDISCSYNESELLLRIEANKDKINSIIDYLKSKGDE